jgi:hypothetical protein
VPGAFNAWPIFSRDSQALLILLQPGDNLSACLHPEGIYSNLPGMDGDQFASFSGSGRRSRV